MKRFQTIALNIWSGVAGLITGEVLCEVIPVLPDSVLFHKNWGTLLSQSSLFLGAWMIFGKALLTSQPPNSLHLAVEGVKKNAERVLCNYFCFVGMIIPVFHQSN